MKPTVFALFLLAFLASMPALATEVYHWVDENGVSHYTQSAPPADVNGVKKVILQDTTPSDFDPEEDRYGVEAQAERMASLREEMAEKREAQRERQSKAAQQPVVQYQQPYPYGYSPFWLPPYYPRPPRPEPPVAPAPIYPFRPPGLNRN